MKHIVDTALAAGQSKALVAAVEAARLDDTLMAGHYTVFAPTNEAFAKLPAGTVEGLLKDVPWLQSILSYHVVPSKVLAREVAGLKSASAVQGGELRVNANQGVKINNAKVPQADVEVSNGVIDGIDTVLMPA